MEKTFTRSEFLRHGLRLMLTQVGEFAVTRIPLGQDSEPEISLIRPPGALPEEDFLKTCTRCDACVQACPPQAIMKFVGEASDQHLTPMLNVRKTPCSLCEGFPCAAVCEPRALTLPLDSRAVKMGIARINIKLCHAWQGMDCDYCVKACPFPGHAIRMDENRRPIVNEEVCTGCGLCEHICPSRESAIKVYK